jgi:flagellar protein FlaG
MNIDLISNANSPPRVAVPEVAATVTRQPATQSKVPEARKETQATDNQVQAKPPEKQEVEKAVAQLAEFVSSKQSQISFSIDESSGSQIVKILDNESKQVIRQFPSEEAVAIARALDKLQGLLIKDKA